MTTQTRYNPRLRYEAVLSGKAPSTEEERSLFVLIHGVDSLNLLLPLKPWKRDSLILSEVEYAYKAIFLDRMLKSTLEAFLLASSENLEVSKALGMTPEEVNTYRTLFFDTSIFRNDLEIIAFLRSLADDEETKELYRLAYNQGFEALRWHFCRDKGNVSPDEVLQTLMLDAYHRARSHRGLSINSKTAQQALKHASLALQCARTIKAESGVIHSDEGLEFKFITPKDNPTVNELPDEGREILN